MKPRLLISIPSLGKRKPQLLSCLQCLEDIFPEARIEIRSPNADTIKSWINVCFPKVSVIEDYGSQSDSILNSWEDGEEEWLTWINDDDFPLLSARSFYSLAEKYADSSDSQPICIYGNLAVVDEAHFNIMRTPKRINLDLLVFGSNYVPGILTFINRSAYNLINQQSVMALSFRNSFDLYWWVVLASKGTQFIHSNSLHAAWRKHPEARTQEEPEIGRDEDRRIRMMYGGKRFRNSTYRTVFRIKAKVLARILLRVRSYEIV